MSTYWFLICLMVCIQFIPSSTNKGAKLKLVASLFFLFIYGAIRTNSGDYSAYLDIFNEIHTGTFYNDRIEKGYILLNQILPSYRWLIIILTAFTCYTYYWFFDRIIPVKYRWLGFLLLGIAAQFTIFFQFSGLRNAITVNLLALGFFCIRDHKWIKFLILTLVAYYFHSSAIVLFPIAFVACYFRPTKKYIIIASIITFLLIFASTALSNQIIYYLNTYFEKYSTYTERALESSGISLLTMSFAVIQIFTLLYILWTEKLSRSGETIVQLSLIYLAALIMGNLNFRATQYFIIFYIAMPAILLSESKKKLANTIILASTFLYLIYSYYIFTLSDYYSYMEYKSLIDQIW